VYALSLILQFDSAHLKQQSQKMILDKISPITRSEKGMMFLRQLPFEELLALLSKDELAVQSEMEIVKIIDAYIEHRKTLPPLPEDQEPNEESWSHLTEEERKHREEERKKKDEE